MPHIGTFLFSENPSIQMNLDALGESLEVLRARNEIPGSVDLMQNVAKIIQASVLQDGRKETEAVEKNNDENIRFQLHLPDGGMLRQHWKGDKYISFQRNI